MHSSGQKRTKEFLLISHHKDLKFEQHINEIVKKANKTAGMIGQYIQYKNKEFMVPLFKSLVRPILEYGNVVCAPCLRKKTNVIMNNTCNVVLTENVQRHKTKHITFT